MPRSTDKPRPERAQTDADLASERGRTDTELEARQATLEEQTDRAEEVARRSSDDALDEARRREDRHLRADTEPDALAWRARQDATIAEDRACADTRRSDERESYRLTIRELLRLEREATDASLLTERVHMDDALLARDDFLAMVSHDLRSLLSGIALQAALLRRRAEGSTGDDLVLRSAEGIERFVARMNRLVGDLVDVASIEAGKLSVQPRRADVQGLVHDTIEAFRPAAEAKGVTLTQEAATGALTASFDYDRVLQVLANLVGNALAFTPEGGRVVVGAEPDGEMVRLWVTDTGSGVPTGQEQVIFERFGQAPQTGGGGLGLGLFISRSIVESHGGRLWLERTSTEGSTFCFTLPGANSTSG